MRSVPCCARTSGRQITYYGHPLYLFDSGPGQVTGEGWDEPGLPPWHGVWNLMAPDGSALPWAGMLTSIRLKGRRVLAVPMLTGIGWLDFPVYSYSNDEPGSSACTGACARAWPPVLTSAMPGIGSPAVQGDVETLSGPGGLQVSYSGQPLYLDAARASSGQDPATRPPAAAPASPTAAERSAWSARSVSP